MQVSVKNNEVINSSINLEVNIKSVTLLNNYLNNLVWYYNEYPVYSSTNINNNATLYIPLYNGGIYQARYEGFLVVPHNKMCEKALLDALQYYPTFRPATLNAMDEGNGKFAFIIISNLMPHTVNYVISDGYEFKG